MANDLDHSKQTLTACNNLLELADVIREKAKQHSELSLQLSEVEKDVIKYKNAKEHWIAITKILIATRDLLTKTNSETSRYICRFLSLLLMSQRTWKKDLMHWQMKEKRLRASRKKIPVFYGSKRIARN